MIFMCTSDAETVHSANTESRRQTGIKKTHTHTQVGKKIYSLLTRKCYVMLKSVKYATRNFPTDHTHDYFSFIFPRFNPHL